MDTSPARERFWFAVSNQMHGAATINGVTESYCGVEIPPGVLKVGTSPSRRDDPPLCEACKMAGLLAALNVLPRLSGRS